MSDRTTSGLRTVFFRSYAVTVVVILVFALYYDFWAARPIVVVCLLLLACILSRFCLLSSRRDMFTISTGVLASFYHHLRRCRIVRTMVFGSWYVFLTSSLINPHY